MMFFTWITESRMCRVNGLLRLARVVHKILHKPLRYVQSSFPIIIYLYSETLLLVVSRSFCLRQMLYPQRVVCVDFVIHIPLLTRRADLSTFGIRFC